MEPKNKRNKLLIILLLIAITIIAIMAYFVYAFYSEKEDKTEEVENLNSKIGVLENRINSLQETIDETSTTNTINNKSVSKENSTTIDNSSNKYDNLTEKIYNQIPENEYFVIQNVSQNSDGTITLKGRVYEDVKLTSISKNEYDGLKSSGNITLFGEKFLLGEYEDYIPGYVLKNSNGYGFYVTDSYELVNFNDTKFLKGTDKYYTITLDKNVKLKLPDGTEETIKASSFETINDNDYINTGAIYDFKFGNEKVLQIIYGI